MGNIGIFPLNLLDLAEILLMSLIFKFSKKNKNLN